MDGADSRDVLAAELKQLRERVGRLLKNEAIVERANKLLEIDRANEYRALQKDHVNRGLPAPPPPPAVQPIGDRRALSGWMYERKLPSWAHLWAVVRVMSNAADSHNPPNASSWNALYRAASGVPARKGPPNNVTSAPTEEGLAQSEAISHGRFDRLRSQRSLLLIGGAVAVAIALIAVFVLIPDDKSGSPADSTESPTLAVDAKVIDRDERGFSMVIPNDYQPPSKFLTMPRAVLDPEFGDGLYAAGGVRLSPVNLEITLTGRSDQELRIMDIRPKIARREDPLGGTLFKIGGEGQSTNIEMLLNLDDLNPVPHEALAVPLSEQRKRGPLQPGEPYFDQHKITLRRGEQEVIKMPTTLSRHYVEFGLLITYMEGTQTHTLTVDHGGKPFRLTAMRSGPEYTRAYGKRADFSICPLNPGNLDDYSLCFNPN